MAFKGAFPMEFEETDAAQMPEDDGRGPDLSGRLIGGKYALGRLLGRGGMGVVYEARNTATEKRVAVKLLTSRAIDSALARRFFREAKASSIAESDHIVSVFDSGTDADTGYPFMVMELLQGEDLDHLASRCAPIRPEQAGRIVLQAAMGLSRAHRSGIVHRDIKPANIFLCNRDSGELLVKVLDFGVAKVVIDALVKTAGGLTQSGSLLGTPLYMSPEQARGESGITAATDVWSLGVVLYQLLSGRTPFEDSTSLGGLMVMIITQDIPPLQDVAPWVPPEFAAVTHRAMSRDISLRYPDAAALQEALERLVGSPRVVPEELSAVPEEVRGAAAPRLDLSSRDFARMTSGSMVVNPTTLSPSSSRSSRPLIVGAALLAATVAGAAVFASARAGVPPAAPPLVQGAASVTSQAPAALTHPLRVAPDGVRVTVEGRDVEVKAGAVSLTAPLGAIVHVQLSLDGRSENKDVVVASQGLVPDGIALSAVAAPQPAPPVERKVAAPSPGAGMKSKASPAPTASPPRRRSGLANDLSEFE